MKGFILQKRVEAYLLLIQGRTARQVAKETDISYKHILQLIKSWMEMDFIRAEGSGTKRKYVLLLKGTAMVVTLRVMKDRLIKLDLWDGIQESTGKLVGEE